MVGYVLTAAWIVMVVVVGTDGCGASTGYSGLD